jgi:DNA-binding Lrp family transcriptional regulator
MTETMSDEGRDTVSNSPAALLEKSGGSGKSRSITRKSSQLLEMLLQNGNRRTVCTFTSTQAELAQKLKITRQALSVHFRRLRSLGLIQVGRGFINVTEDGMEAMGHNTNPVVLMVRVHPQNRLEAFARIRELPVASILRVTGDWDLVLMTEQEHLDHILSALSRVEGVQETKSLVTIMK